MPNRPDNPYDRFPLKAAVGLLLMLSGAVALLFLSATWQDWRQAALGALLLFTLIGTAMALRRLKIRPLMTRPARKAPAREPSEPAGPPTFDPAGFVEATKRRHQASPLRQIEKREHEGKATEAKHRTVIGAETVRRLQDLRDHPSTPDTERRVADEKFKKARTKRRSAWSKHP